MDMKPVGDINLREFVKLTSSWPPARVEGGSELRLLPPLPVDPRDPRTSSKSCKFFVFYTALGDSGDTPVQCFLFLLFHGPIF